MDGTEQLARVVLRAANQTQAKGSAVRPIVPLAPEVAQELGMELDDDVIMAAEEYLLNRGYVVPANIGLSWGTYTITTAGFSWLEESSPADRLRELAEKPGEGTAFESVLQAELEKERHLMEEIEQELGEEHQEALEAGVEVQERGELRPSTGGAQKGAEPRSRWRRMFGG